MHSIRDAINLILENDKLWKSSFLVHDGFTFQLRLACDSPSAQCHLYTANKVPRFFFFSEGEEEILLIVIAQWLTAIPTELGAGGCRFET